MKSALLTSSLLFNDHVLRLISMSFPAPANTRKAGNKFRFPHSHPTPTHSRAAFIITHQIPNISRFTQACERMG